MVDSDSVILGHNQFLGINYLTQEKGRQLKSKFEDVEKVRDVLSFSLQHGVNGLMFSNNDLLTPLIRALSKEELDSTRFYPVITFFQGYVRDKLQPVPGYGTETCSFRVSRFKAWGIARPKVMAAFNKLGFLMNPSKESCEEALRKFDGDLFAMSTLAGGRLEPSVAYEYVNRLPKLRAIIVGYSSAVHGLETLRSISSAAEKTSSSFSDNVKLQVKL